MQKCRSIISGTASQSSIGQKVRRLVVMSSSVSGSSSATGLDWQINEGAGIHMVSFKVSANGALTVAFVGVQGLTCGELR